MSENRRFVGFGIVGAPKGRQYSSAGADKEINFAKYFDLSQVYGGALPPPKQDQLNTTLYYLTYREIATGKKVLGIAEYRSAGEMGQSRPGSYLGSFVESINSRFTSIASIFSALYKMNKYQVLHFLDHQEVCYNAMIDGVSFDAPEDELNNIANTLDKLRIRSIPDSYEEDLYIYLSDDKERENVLEEILKRDLFYIYNNIYFSSSRFIYERLKENNRRGIKIISSSALFFTNSISNLYQSEVDRLKTNIKQVNDKLVNIEKERESTLEKERLSLEQHYRQESEQRIKEVEMIKDQELAKLGNERNTLENELNKAKNELEQQRNRLQESQKMEMFAGEIIRVFSESKTNISEINLEKLPSIQSNRELYKQIGTINQNLSSLSNDKIRLESIGMDLNELKQHYVKIPKEVRKESIFTWIFLATSLLFAIILGINYFFDETNKSNKNDSPIIASSLDSIKNELQSIQKDVSVMKRDIQQIQHPIDTKLVEPVLNKNSKKSNK